MGIKKIGKVFTGFVMTVALSISCPGVENLAGAVEMVYAASSESRGQEKANTAAAQTVTWKQKGSKRYCYRNGKKLTGFQKVGNSYYYFDSKGSHAYRLAICKKSLSLFRQKNRENAGK